MAAPGDFSSRQVSFVWQHAPESLHFAGSLWRNMYCAKRFGFPLVIVLWSIALHGADRPPDSLKLVATVNGASTSQFSFREQLLPLFDGKPAAMGSTISWRLEGDVLVDPELIRFPLDYSVRRRPMKNHPKARDEPVTVNISWVPRSDRWPYNKFDNAAALVIVWMLQSRPVKVVPVFLPAMRNDSGTQRHQPEAEVSFSLQLEHVGGFPLVLLLGREHWIKQGEYSHNPQFQQAVVALYREDDAAFSNSLEQIPDVDAMPGGARASLLSLAAETGHLFAVDALLRRGAKVGQITPLSYAVANGHGSIVVRLLEPVKVASINASSFDELFRKALDHQWTEIAWMLLTARPDGNRDARRIEAIAMHSVEIEDLNTIRQIAAVAEHDQFAQASPRLLATAAAKLEPEYVRTFLRGGADVDGSSEGFTPLIVAATLNRADTMRELLQAGPKVDHRGHKGATALFAAAKFSHLEVAQLLLDAGANPNVADDQGATPLHECVAKDNFPLASLLTTHGAQFDAKNLERETPLTLAFSRSSKAMLELLTDSGAHLPLQSPEFPAMLERCLVQDHLLLLQRAVADGWNPNDRIRKVWPAWQVSELWGATSSAAWLQTNSANASGLVVYRLAEVDQPPKALSITLGGDARFFYPSHLATGVELTGVIGPDGTLIFARIERSPHSHLSKLVIDAIRGWTFQASIKENLEVPVRIRLVVTFAVDQRRKENPDAKTIQFREVPKS